MGERKQLNKFYPPDIDPTKIEEEYAKKGSVTDAHDYSVQYLRQLHIPRCLAEIILKTDPKNSDYILESGASGNFEPWRGEDEAANREKRKRNAEDSMKSLENRTMDSKIGMDILAALDELKFMKSRRHATVSVDSMLQHLRRSAQESQKKLEEEEEVEVLIRSIFQGWTEFVRRVHDEDFSDDEDLTLTIDNGVILSNDLKMRKVSGAIASNPTGHLRNISIVAGCGKISFNSCNKPAKEEKNQEEEH